jgi:hypothetical protein
VQKQLVDSAPVDCGIRSKSPVVPLGPLPGGPAHT